MIYIFWSCRTEDEAKSIIHKLLDNNLIACASLLPSVYSIYRWGGNIEEGQEVKVILKTVSEHFRAIEEVICLDGSYEVPEIVQIEIACGHLPYLKWVEEQTVKNS